MKKSIFIGNGLNRVMIENISWDNLLESLEKEYSLKKINNKIPFPLQFECIVNEYFIQKSKKLSVLEINELDDIIYDDFKMKIIAQINRDDNLDLSILSAINFNEFDSIITTNYDLNIEKSLGINKNDINSINGNTKYLLEKISMNSGAEKYQIFHSHGICTNIKSICLGYEHYCRLIENSRNKIVEKINKKKYIVELIESQDGSNVKIKYWFDNFFITDVYIIGFGLYESEIDIWWILSYRASIIATNREKLRDKVKNKIVYYDIIKKNDDSKIKIHEMLKSMFVEVVVKEIEDDTQYSYEYNKIIEEINKKVKKEN